MTDLLPDETPELGIRLVPLPTQCAEIDLRLPTGPQP